MIRKFLLTQHHKTSALFIKKKQNKTKQSKETKNKKPACLVLSIYNSNYIFVGSHIIQVNCNGEETSLNYMEIFCTVKDWSLSLLREEKAKYSVCIKFSTENEEFGIKLE